MEQRLGILVVKTSTEEQEEGEHGRNDRLKHLVHRFNSSLSTLNASLSKETEDEIFVLGLQRAREMVEAQREAAATTAPHRLPSPQLLARVPVSNKLTGFHLEVLDATLSTLPVEVRSIIGLGAAGQMTAAKGSDRWPYGGCRVVQSLGRESERTDAEAEVSLRLKKRNSCTEMERDRVWKEREWHNRFRDTERGDTEKKNEKDRGRDILSGMTKKQDSLYLYVKE